MKFFIKKSFASLLGTILCVPVFAGITVGNVTNNNMACPTITVTLTFTNVKCYGNSTGLVAATATGGVSPYTYSWTSGSTIDSAKNLTAGSYTVTATDNNGCTGTATVTITQPSQIRDSISRQTNDNCFGSTNGSLRDGVKGGAGTYTYAWKPSGGTGRTANGLTAGTYTVVVTDANGCKDSTTGTITQPTQIKDSIQVTNVACKGAGTGSITSFSTTGGTSPYSYTWSTGATTSSITGLAAGTYTLSIRDKNFCNVTYTVTVAQPATALTLTASQQAAATCGQSNGSAYATVAGGNMPYDFTWSPSGGTNDTAKGLAAGSYSVIVTDSNGCSITASTSVANNSTLASTASSTSVTPCFGGNNGTVLVTTTGGTSPYNYSWSTGATTSSVGSLSAGIYSVTVTDASGCITTNNDTVKQPTQVKDSVSAFTDPKCNGSNNGTATALTTGGTGPYTYLWSDGQTTTTATNLAAGTYTVTATDANGCTASNTVILSQPSAIRDSATTLTNVSCFGGANGSIRIGVSGGSAPYTYSWAPGGSTRNRVNGASAGTYTVTITDANGCTKIDSFKVTQPATALTAAITDSTMVACFGSKTASAVVTATGGTPGYTYTWAASGGTKDTAMNISAGTYTVNVRDANACTTTATVVITQPASAVTATSKTYAASCAKNNGAAVVNATGGTPGYTYTWSPSGQTTDSASAIGQGIYTCLITDAKGCTYTVSANVADSSTLALAIVSQTNVTPCFGDANGTATVRPSGGAPGYTYSWSPYGGTDTAATGLVGGTYTVTVKDTKGCAVSDTIIITRPALLLANITSHTNPTCNGGTGRATVTASGGTPGYTYSWAPGGITSATANGIAAGLYTVTITDKNGCTANDTITISQPPAITDSITSTNITCFGSNNGGAMVSANGGTPGYTYTWTPGGKTTPTVNNLTAGTYTVTIRDASFCTATGTVTITEPTQLRDSVVTSANIMCFGNNNGSATIGAKGGTPGYTYSWTPGGNTSATVNSLTAGSYTVTITDANGCTGTANVSITQPATALADSATTVTASCGNSNGSASVYTYNGTPGYTYSWNTGATTSSVSGVAAGTYTCNITDANGCSSSQIVIVNDNSTLAASITAHVAATCNGSCNGSATASATGGTGPYTYSWAPGGQTTASITGLCAGKYTFTATDSHGCISSDTVTIVQPAMLTVVIDSSITGGCTNSVWAVVSGGTPPYSYSWTPGGQTADTASSLCNGTYSVTVTDANSCSANANIVVASPTGIAQVQNGTASVKLYPVPTTGLLNISIAGTNFTAQAVMVYDLTGRKLVDQKVNGANNLFTVDLSSLEQGSYILKLVGKNNTEKIERFTVVK